MKILVTLGATREPIDSVRYITNMSTGNTGSVIADAFAKEGHIVYVLAGQGAITPHAATELLEFTTFEDLNEKLMFLMRTETFDVVIHAAAVSDYSIDAAYSGPDKLEFDPYSKFDSEEDDLKLHLKKNFKIIDRIKDYAVTSTPVLVGFKLTSHLNPSDRAFAVDKLWRSSRSDFIVHNDLEDIQREQQIFSLYKLGDLIIDDFLIAELTPLLLREILKLKEII